MKQIDEYLNKLYKGLKSSESKESKEEMKIHILEIVNELKQDGKNEQEAIKIALERFGEQDLLNGGLWFLFNNQKKLSRSIFKFGICFLGIAFIAALILVGLDIDHPFFVQFEEKIPTTLFTLFFMMTNTFFTIAGILLVIWLWITFSHKMKIRRYQVKS
ncbi:permease prefix domain 1-containing protein [Peribacillus castrilensis]|uniref:permease prefix domain 1-containing protein n=1 Tax=Peribacillus castrilensis TaxID=2897690 RepID=UPI003D2BD52B